MRVVVDPNVVVSALLTPGGAADEIVRTVLSGGLVAVVSPRLLDEVREVAGRPKFSHLDPQNVERVLEGLESCELVSDRAQTPQSTTGPKTADPKDDYLVTLSLNAAVDALVSGDRALQAASIEGLQVRSPRQLLDDLSG